MWLFAIARNAMLDHAHAAKERPWQGNLVDPPTAQGAGATIEDPSEDPSELGVRSPARARADEGTCDDDIDE